MEIDPGQVIQGEAALSELYGPAPGRSVRKQVDHLDDLCRAFIAASPLIKVVRNNPYVATAGLSTKRARVG